MASLSDIPAEFLQAETADGLLDWLDTLPLIPYTRTQILALWHKATDINVTPTQWARARKPSPHYHG